MILGQEEESVVVAYTAFVKTPSAPIEDAKRLDLPVASMIAFLLASMFFVISFCQNEALE